MSDSPPERLEVKLRRLHRERDEADRRYNEALTALDRAVPQPFQLPRKQGDRGDRLAELNQAWNTVPGPPSGSGLKGRLAGFIWRTVAPYLERQLAFNATLVDHLNRNAAAQSETDREADETAASIEAQFAALAEFCTRLIVFVQQVTAFVDTKDQEGTLLMNAAISALAEDLDKRWESLQDLRTAVSISQAASVSLKREVQRLLAGQRPGTTNEGIAHASAAFAPAPDAHKYVGFEDRFRGSREEIRGRFESYVPLFAGMSDVLDVGCGRGEFLELLGASGIRARGIDLNHEMAELCRSRGLDVTEADAVNYLSSLPDGSLGGLFAAQVVEHLGSSYLLQFLDLAFQKLRPGAVMVLETLNPTCWIAFFDSYIRDITHVWPLHPETLKFLVLASGFTGAEIQYRAPVPEPQKLRVVETTTGTDTALLHAFNENANKLNALMFTFLDYVVVGRR